MFDYGKHIQGSQVLIFFITNLDNAFVGRLRGSDDLGVYGRAFNLSNTPATHITRLVGQVMFPALSRMRDSLTDQRRVFLRAVKYTALVSIPLGVGIFVFAAGLSWTSVYGGKWNNAIVPMQCWSSTACIRSIAGNMGDVFKAGGKPQWLFGIAPAAAGDDAHLPLPGHHPLGHRRRQRPLSRDRRCRLHHLATYLVNRMAATTWRDFAAFSSRS